MKHCSIKIIGVVCIMFFVLPHLVIAESTGYSLKDYIFRIPGPTQKSTLYADGSVIELQTETKTWPIIGSDLTNMTPEEFKRMVETGRKAFRNNPNKIVVSADGQSRGLDIVYNVSNPPPGAVEALDSVAAYIERTFDDDVTVNIDVGFSPMGQGVLGWCMSYFTTATWPVSRNGLINGMDDDDTIQVWLPSGSTIPVRYNYYSGTVTNEDKSYFTKANYRATIGTVSGLAAHIEFNSDYIWDYDPSDGITAMCFQSVATHETGHCLGFTCGSDRFNEIEALDIYRFQRSDDGSDYNPDTYEEFQTTARMVDEDDGSIYDDVNSDLITVEYRMSDANPYQTSHFSMNNVYAIMQPAIGSGQTYWPHFFKLPDKLMFDAIGWDYLLSYGLTITIVGNGSVTRDPDYFTYQPGTEVVLTAIPADTTWEFDEWTGDLGGSQNPDTIVMDDDMEITAHFASLYYTLTINIIGSGSVDRNPDMPSYPLDTPVELTAIPDQGWAFDHWSGNLWGSQNPDTIVMNGNKTVTAHFTGPYVAENQTDNIQTPFLDIFPNPSKGTVTITYNMGQSNNVGSIIIYDVTGQLVRDLPINQFTNQPIHQIAWDGRNDAGKDLPNGVYFVKFRAGDYRETRKLLMLK